MADLLQIERSFNSDAVPRAALASTVGQEILLDVVAVGFEHHPGAAQLTNLFVGALDHPVPLARHRRQHFSGAGDLEALLGARFALHLGHLALLCRQSVTDLPDPWLEIERAD